MTIQNSDSKAEQKPDSKATHGEKPKAVTKRFVFLPMIAGVIFLLLAAAVFLLSETQARKSNLGFPAFADSHFDLIDQNGVPRTNADFAGKPIALFFGFTYCPDVCPTTLLALAGGIDDLIAAGNDASDIQILFVTVDHERDTPEQLQSYLTLFDVPATGLTGDAAAISRAIGAFGAYAKKVEQGDGNYIYDHSAAVYLYQRDGSFKGTIVFNEPEQFIVEKLKSLL